MKRLNELIEKVGNISLGEGLSEDSDIYAFLRRFFSKDDIKEMLVRMNQQMLFREQTNRDGNRMGTYVPDVSRRKVKKGLPSVNYTFYDTGSFYSSMDVEVRNNEVEVVSSDRGLDLDSINAFGHHPSPDMDSIYWMFNMFDREMKSLGLTDDYFDNFVEESEMCDEITKNLKEYLNG